MQYICQICGYIYDEEKEGKKFEELGEDFSCPSCKVGKKGDFKLVEPMAVEVEEIKAEEIAGTGDEALGDEDKD